MDYTPDIFVHSYKEITPDLLSSKGIKGLLTDLDDTLVTHGNMFVNDEVKSWVRMISGSGIGICIVSNNTTGRVKPFADELGVPFICNAMKPFTGFIDKGAVLLGISKDDIALMGDQLFTDIKAAKKADVFSILVDPVGTKTTPWIRIKRIRENRLRKKFRRLNDE